MISTLSSLMTPRVVIKTIHDVASDGKVGIVKTLGFQCCCVARTNVCMQGIDETHRSVLECLQFTTTMAIGTHITMTSWWVRWRLKLPASRLFVQPFIQAKIKENIKALRHWPLWGEFTGHRWIPRTKGQLRGKCFHLMTSSWDLRSDSQMDTPSISWYFLVSRCRYFVGLRRFNVNREGCIYINMNNTIIYIFSSLHYSCLFSNTIANSFNLLEIMIGGLLPLNQHCTRWVTFLNRGL